MHTRGIGDNYNYIFYPYIKYLYKIYMYALILETWKSQNGYMLMALVPNSRLCPSSLKTSAVFPRTSIIKVPPLGPVPFSLYIIHFLFFFFLMDLSFSFICTSNYNFLSKCYTVKQNREQLISNRRKIIDVFLYVDLRLMFLIINHIATHKRTAFVSSRFFV